MKTKSLIFAITLTLLNPTLLFAQTITITDMADRRVEAPFDPGRIVSIGPGALRLIVYLQATEKVVGVEGLEKQRSEGRPYRIAHPALADLPTIGPGGPASINKKPDMEAMLRANPQVIFATYMERSTADDIQKTLGVPVVVLSYGALGVFDKAVYQALRVAGEVLNRKVRAEAVVSYIERIQGDLRARTEKIPDERKPGVYVGGIGHRGAHGIESTDRSYMPLDWLNAVNLSGRLESAIGDHLFADKEMLLALNPEVIFIDGGGLALVREDYRKKPEFYRALKAYQNRRIYALLPFNFYTTNIGTALVNAYAIGKILYPDRFKDVDPAKRADEIYTFLVGEPVYDAMAAEYGEIGRVMPFSE